MHSDLWDENLLKSNDGNYVINDWERAKVDVPFTDIMFLSVATQFRDKSVERYFRSWQTYGNEEELKKVAHMAVLKDNNTGFEKQYKYLISSVSRGLDLSEVDKLRLCLEKIEQATKACMSAQKSLNYPEESVAY